MDKKNNNPWILIAIVAAVAAAVAALVVFLLRARAKQKAWYDQEAIDCEMDDCECFEFDDEDVEIADTDVDE